MKLLHAVAYPPALNMGCLAGPIDDSEIHSPRSYMPPVGPPPGPTVDVAPFYERRSSRHLSLGPMTLPGQTRILLGAVVRR
jgi:hypothetical protein